MLVQVKNNQIWYYSTVFRRNVLRFYAYYLWYRETHNTVEKKDIKQCVSHYWY